MKCQAGDFNWKARMQHLENKISKRVEPLSSIDRADVLEIVMCVCGSMAENGMESSFFVSQSDLYTKVWLFRGNYVNLTAHLYNKPDTPPMPHTHSFNFFSFCANGLYEHKYYTRRPLKRSLAGEDRITWYGAARPRSFTEEDHKMRKNVRETNGHKIGFALALQDTRVHMPACTSTHACAHTYIHTYIQNFAFIACSTIPW